VGDLTVIGAQSEFVCLPEDRLTPVPEDLDAAEAVSLILPYVTAYQMLHRLAGIRRKQRILVHGAGGAVGTAMLQLGSLLELEMYGTASAAKHELVSSLGATPIDYRRDDWADRLAELAHGGVDAVFDPIGGHSFKQSFTTLRSKGVLVAFGFYNAVMGKGGNIPLDFLRLKLWNMLPNSRRAVFYSIAALRKQQPHWFTEDLTTLFDLLSRGKIKPRIFQRLPLSQVKKAHELLENAAVQGKIVFDCAGS
jgi:NADPH:quinone reductase-like Zn-dependent oxidoreductase